MSRTDTCQSTLPAQAFRISKGDRKATSQYPNRKEAGAGHSTATPYRLKQVKWPSRSSCNCPYRSKREMRTEEVIPTVTPYRPRQPRPRRKVEAQEGQGERWRKERKKGMQQLQINSMVPPSRSRSRQRDSRENQLGSCPGVSPTKRMSQNPKSTSSTQLSNSKVELSSRSHAPR
jgi:hypothetical protein